MKFLIFISVLAFIFISCNNQEDNPENIKEIIYKSERIQQINDSLQYSIDVGYPVLLNAYSDEIQVKVNKYISKSVTANINVFKKGLLSQEELEKYSMEITNELINKDSVLLITNKVFSFYLEYYYYFAGAAHGNTYFDTYNFNLNSGHIIELEELFYEESSYLEKISELCYRHLSESIRDYNDEEMMMDGTVPNRENYENFILTDKGILFIFEPYQVAAYVAGPQFVDIPYTDLEGIINPSRLLEIGIEINETKDISRN